LKKLNEDTGVEMKLSTIVTALEKQQKTCLIIGIYEDNTLTPAAKQLDAACHGSIKKFLNQGNFEGKIGQTLPLFSPLTTEYAQILFIGCGKSESLTATSFRKITQTAIKALLLLPVKEATCFLTELEIPNQTLPWKIKQITEVAHENLYRFDLFKSEKSKTSCLKALFLPIPHAKEMKACELALTQGQAVAEGVT
jgi:leucyl aminopeptidase